MQTVQKPNKVAIPPDDRARFSRALDFVIVMLKHEHSLLLRKECDGDVLLNPSIICTTSTQRPSGGSPSVVALLIAKASTAQPMFAGASKASIGWTVRSPPSTASVCRCIRGHCGRCRRMVLRMSSESACSPGRLTKAVPQRLRCGRVRGWCCFIIDSMSMVFVQRRARPRIIIQVL